MRTVCFRAKYFSIILVMSLLWVQSLFAAGTGTIKVKILDTLTGDPLVGVNVVVAGTNYGSASNLEGKVTIHDVPSGEKTLKISYIGYYTIIEQVVVPDGGIVQKEFRLTHQPKYEGEAVITIIDKAPPGAINQQLQSVNVTNVVSHEKMQEMPDATIAESIGMLPGVSLNRQNGEANQVIIRGMSPQFNNVTIEGVPMVSTNGGLAATNSNNGSSNYSDRSIDLSMITDDMVNSAEVSKSLMPNMDADAIGGTVNLTLREAQAGLHSDLKVDGGYNDLAANWKNYKAAGSISDRFFNDALGVRVQLNAEDKSLPSQQFNAGYRGVTPNSASNPLVINGVTYSLIQWTTSARLTQDNLDRKRYGGSVVLDYESDFVDLKFFNIYNEKKDHESKWDYTTSFDQATLPNNYGEFSGLCTIQDFTTEERTHSLQAKFKFAGTELDASYAYTKSDYSNPVYGFSFLQNNTGDPYGSNENAYAQPSTLMAVSYPLLNKNNWYMPYIDYAHNFFNDNTNDVKVDYHIPFNVSDDFSGKISIGGKYHEFARVTNGFSEYFNMQWNGAVGSKILNFLSFLQAYYPNPWDREFDLNQGVSALNFTQAGYIAPSFLKGAYQLPSWNYDQNLLYNIGQNWQAFEPSGQWWVDGPQSYNSDIYTKEELGASYIMGEFNIGSNLSLVGGVRWEQVKGHYSAWQITTNNSNQNGLGQGNRIG